MARLKDFRNPGGPKVYLISHFLKAMGKPANNVGVYAELWNRTLGEDGFEVQFERLRFNSGSNPWVGTKAAFRRVWAFL